MNKLDGIKAGQEVEITFRAVMNVPDAFGAKITTKTGKQPMWFSNFDVKDPTFQITRIEPALAVGDEVLVFGYRNGNQSIVGFLSDGRAIVEYQAGDSSNVCAYDISCLTHA